MIWKELYAERSLHFSVTGQSLLTMLGLATLAPALILAGVCWMNLHGSSVVNEDMVEATNRYVRLASLLLFGLMALGIGMRATGSIGSERDRQTMDSLLASPLSLASILFAKWLGSVASVRWITFMLVSVWVLGVSSGGLHWKAIPWVLACLVIYSAFMASLGLRFAVEAKTSLRAVMGTVVTFLVLAIGPWLVASQWSELSGWGDAVYRSVSPAWGVYASTFWDRDLDYLRLGTSYRPQQQAEITFEQLACVALAFWFYGLAALWLWIAALRRFRETCGRISRRPRWPPRAMRGILSPNGPVGTSSAPPHALRT